VPDLPIEHLAHRVQLRIRAARPVQHLDRVADRAARPKATPPVIESRPAPG
jgi:hypothetical protein